MRVISLVFMLLGCFLGAGFVSGKEVATYFSVFGKSSILGIIVLSVLIFILLMFFLSLSNRVENFKNFVNVYFGKLAHVINFLFAFTMLIFIGSMFAGNYVIANTLKINKFVLLLITIILTFCFASKKSSGLSKLNLILMPIVICVLMYLTFSRTVNLGGSGNGISAIFTAINYVLINIVPLGIFILDIRGDKKYSKKEIVLISLITTMIIGILLAVYNNAITSNNLQHSTMPILEISKNKGFLISLITALSIWLGLLTTLVSCVFVLSNYINSYLRNYSLSLFLSISLGVIVSFMGFDIIVNYVYTIIGIIGLIVIISVIFQEKRNKKINSYSP